MSDLLEDHQLSWREIETHLSGIGITPPIGIGQRSLFVAAGDEGGVLWDCIPLVDDRTIRRLRDRGGVRAIALSHPHFYATMVSWSEALGGVPIYVHEADREWIMRPSDAIRTWSGEHLEIGSGLTLVRCDGHFAGGTVLHWAAGANGKGALLTSDIVTVAADTRWVSFMRSFPNYIPLSARKVRAIVETLEPFAFDRIYGGWWPSIVDSDAKASVKRSAERYISWLEN